MDLPRGLDGVDRSIVLSIISNAKRFSIKSRGDRWGGHKHVDIYIPKDKLYIEIDGAPHYTRPDKIIADFNRDYFSFKEGFFTKHITNEAIDSHLEEIAEAIANVVQNAPNKIGGTL
jgi:very-short-patch-repair endonuclease